MYEHTVFVIVYLLLAGQFQVKNVLCNRVVPYDYIFIMKIIVKKYSERTVSDVSTRSGRNRENFFESL